MAQSLRIQLGPDREVMLPANSSWAPRVFTYAGLGRPLEIGATPQGEVTDVRVPYIGRLAGLVDGDGSTHLLLSESARAVSLPSDISAESLDLLRAELARGSRVAVVTTEDCSQVVLDRVHAAPPRVMAEPPCADALPEAEVLGLTSAVSLDVAKDAAREVWTHRIATYPPPMRSGGLPLAYPQDGCWVIAHAICGLLMRTRNLDAGKVWVRPDTNRVLTASSPNSPSCRVAWSFHVAAFFRPLKSMHRDDLLVIDPVLTNGPHVLRFEDWKARMGNVGQISVSGAGSYRLDHGCAFDGELADDLEALRDQSRYCCRRAGAPPYAAC